MDVYNFTVACRNHRNADTELSDAKLRAIPESPKSPDSLVDFRNFRRPAQYKHLEPCFNKRERNRNIAGRTKVINGRFPGSGTGSPNTSNAPWRVLGGEDSTHPESTPFLILRVATG
jgi:hypothetical protein